MPHGHVGFLASKSLPCLMRHGEIWNFRENCLVTPMERFVAMGMPAMAAASGRCMMPFNAAALPAATQFQLTGNGMHGECLLSPALITHSCDSCLYALLPLLLISGLPWFCMDVFLFFALLSFATMVIFCDCGRNVVPETAALLSSAQGA